MNIETDRQPQKEDRKGDQTLYWPGEAAIAFVASSIICSGALLLLMLPGSSAPQWPLFVCFPVEFALRDTAFFRSGAVYLMSALLRTTIEIFFLVRYWKKWRVVGAVAIFHIASTVACYVSYRGYWLFL